MPSTNRISHPFTQLWEPRVDLLLWSNPRICVGAKSSLRRKGPMSDPRSSRDFRPESHGRKFLLISALQFVQLHNKQYRCVEGWWAIAMMANDHGMRLNPVQRAAQNSREFAGAEEKLQTFKSFSFSGGPFVWGLGRVWIPVWRSGLGRQRGWRAVWEGRQHNEETRWLGLQGLESTVWIESQFGKETQRKKRYFQLFCYFINTMILATCDQHMFLLCVILPSSYF